jgi:hypothetical protein
LDQIFQLNESLKWIDIYQDSDPQAKDLTTKRIMHRILDIIGRKDPQNHNLEEFYV